MENLVRNMSTPGRMVPLLLNRAGNKYDNGECCALTLKKAVSSSTWKTLVDEAFEIHDFIKTHDLKCSRYDDKHSKCVINCASLVDVPKTGESRIRLLEMDGEDQETPYKICYNNEVLNIQLLKLPITSSIGCLSFDL